MGTLDELRAKYQLGQGAKYEPKQDCKKCGGAGECQSRDGKWRFCICLFVSPDMVDIASETLAATARRLAGELREKMKGGA